MAVATGLLFSASAYTAHGTDLRSGRRLRLTELIATEAGRVEELAAEARRIQDEVDAATAEAASRDAGVMRAQRGLSGVGSAVGLSPVTGPGVLVTLDDAPRGRSGQSRPGNPAPDDLVVHEQDVLAVINALWAGGAEAVSVMGDRLINTSAVRCVGNTLLLHGRVYSPPFRIAGIGPTGRLLAALDAAPGVRLFRGYVAAYGLGYAVNRSARIAMPAYSGPVSLVHSRRVT